MQRLISDPNRRLIRFRGLHDLPPPSLCGGPCHRVLNPDGEHLLLRLTSAIGDGRRPTLLVHFITPYSPPPRISHEMEFCAGTPPSINESSGNPLAFSVVIACAMKSEHTAAQYLNNLAY